MVLNAKENNQKYASVPKTNSSDTLLALRNKSMPREEGSDVWVYLHRDGSEENESFDRGENAQRYA